MGRRSAGRRFAGRDDRPDRRHVAGSIDHVLPLVEIDTVPFPFCAQVSAGLANPSPSCPTSPSISAGASLPERRVTRSPTCRATPRSGRRSRHQRMATRRRSRRIGRAGGVAAETTFVTDAAGRFQLTLFLERHLRTAKACCNRPSSSSSRTAPRRLSNGSSTASPRRTGKRAALLERLAAAEIDRIIGQTFLHDPIVVTIEYWEPTVPGSTASAAAFPSACAALAPGGASLRAPLDTYRPRRGCGPARRTLCWWGVLYGSRPRRRRSTSSAERPQHHRRVDGILRPISPASAVRASRRSISTADPAI